MDDFQYNWLMGSIRDFSSQQSLLFCRDDSPSLEGREPEHVLKEVFGYEQFRPLQREVIQNVLDGRDTLAVMPTGGGKSLCYEIPALILDGLTIVVSPLIALMQDQVTQLEAAGVPAVFINSTLGTDAYWESCARIRSGEIKLLYVSPEGLNTERMRELLHSCRLPVKCITIDEAHCISEWGHDFRPDYMEIAAVRAQFPRAVCLALTATATASVRQDIVAQLRMEDPAVLVASFNRPNIYLEVRRKQRPAAQLVEFLNAPAGQAAAGRLQRNRLPRGACGRRACIPPVRLHQRTNGHYGGNRGVRHGHQQAGCALRRALRHAEVNRTVLPGNRARGAGRAAVPCPAALQRRRPAQNPLFFYGKRRAGQGGAPA